MDKRYYQLLQLVSLLYELQSQDRVQHDYKEELYKGLQSKSYVDLLSILIGQMTLLNRAYRIKENGIYRSEREDLVMSLQLLERDIKGNTLVNPVLRLCYERLRKRIGTHRIFTRIEVERLTGYKRSQIQKILKNLEVCDKIERKGGNRRTGYFYQLLE